MNNINEEKDLLVRILDMLERHFGNRSEIVLHDLTLDYEHTIVDIRNAHITERKIGDCGSNLGLEVLRETAANGDQYNYITYTRDAKILRSSSLYIRNCEKVIGAICINTDITDSVKFENYLHSINNYSLESEGKKKEFFATDVKQLLEHFLKDGEDIVGKPASYMNKEDKMIFLKYLDDNGAFLITKSSDRVCEFLNISRFTLYSYLEALRGKSNKIQNKEEG